jgi:guanine deaminase
MYHANRRIYIGLISPFRFIVQIADQTSGKGIGPLDFLDAEYSGGIEDWTLSHEVIEKWWCLGDFRNRVSMWVQGKEVSPTIPPK